MYRSQKGIQPTLTNLSVVLLILANGYMSARILVLAQNESLSVLKKVMACIMPSMFFVFPILILASKFPDIKLSPRGIEYRYLQFWGSLILWEEMSEFIKLEKPNLLRGYYALIIDRKGYSPFFRFKGLYFLAFHGIRLKASGPVLLISSNTLSENEIQKIKLMVKKNWQRSTENQTFLS